MIDKEKVFDLLLKEKIKISNRGKKYVMKKAFKVLLNSEKDLINIIIDALNDLSVYENAVIEIKRDKWNIKLIKEINWSPTTEKKVEEILIQKIDEQWLANKIHTVLVDNSMIEITINDKEDLEFLDNLNPMNKLVEKFSNNELYLSEGFIKFKNVKNFYCKSLKEICSVLNTDKDKENELINEMWGQKASKETVDFFNEKQKPNKIENILMKNYESNMKELKRRFLSGGDVFQESSIFRCVRYNVNLCDITQEEKEDAILKMIFNRILSKSYGKSNLINASLYNLLVGYIQTLENTNKNIDKFSEVIHAYLLLANDGEEFRHLNVLDKNFSDAILQYYTEENKELLTLLTKELPKMEHLIDYVEFKKNKTFEESEVKINRSISVEISKNVLIKYVPNLRNINFAEIVTEGSSEGNTYQFKLSIENIKDLTDKELKKHLMDVVTTIDPFSTVEEFNNEFRERVLLSKLPNNEDKKERKTRVKI